MSLSPAFPVCVGISGSGGLPFPTPSLGHLPSWHCLPPCWDETRLSGSTGVLAAAEGSAPGQCGEPDDGAPLPSCQPVKNQASTYGLHFWQPCSPHAHHPTLFPTSTASTTGLTASQRNWFGFKRDVFCQVGVNSCLSPDPGGSRARGALPGREGAAVGPGRREAALHWAV